MLKLYVHPASPPSRAVLILLKSLNLNLEIVQLDIFKGAQYQSEFLKLNPQHTVPTLVLENGTTLWDSHAIMAYIVDKYVDCSTLYPRNLEERAKINQRLHFESGNVFSLIIFSFRGFLFRGKTAMDDTDVIIANEAYENLNTILENSKWTCGQRLTIADYSLYTSVTSLKCLVPLDAKMYQNVEAWLENCRRLPEIKVQDEGMELFSKTVQGFLNESQRLSD